MLAIAIVAVRLQANSVGSYCEHTGAAAATCGNGNGGGGVGVGGDCLKYNVFSFECEF